MKLKQIKNKFCLLSDYLRAKLVNNAYRYKNYELKAKNKTMA